MMIGSVKFGLVSLLTAAVMTLPQWSNAQDSSEWQPGIAVVGSLQHPNGFENFNYVNLDAPKAGALRLSVSGTFDTLNPYLDRGELPADLNLVFDTLLETAQDELSASYGLLAEGMKVADDFSSVTFKLREEAKWADGQPVRPEDVIFSFENAKELNPRYAIYYKHVTDVNKTGDREVTFTFDEKNNKELPMIVGQLNIAPQHWWEGKDSAGNQRDITKGTLEPVLGSGPYRVSTLSPGSTINYELRDDYWGKDLNVNRGRHNFRNVSYNYFSDSDVEMEAFKAGNVDYRTEQSSSKWMTGYDIPAVKNGSIIREELPNIYRSIGLMQGFAFNGRREKFQNPKLREALNYAFDFEELNRTLAHGQLLRIDSYYQGSEMASSGLPTGRELEILEEIRDQVPPDVFTKEYVNPIGGEPTKQRENLRKAVQLLKEAGYELRGNRMVNALTGEQLSIEFLIDSTGMERTILPYTQSLKRIGINASVRLVDAAQFTNRSRSFDFDTIVKLWGTGANPGNEQADYWGSAAADKPGSNNVAGIKNPAVDHLVQKVIFAPNRDEQLAAIRALDRVLLFNHYVVPQFHRGMQNVAYWNTISRPENLPEYGTDFPSSWWSLKQ